MNDPRPLLDLYRSVYTARQVDGIEQALINRGEAFFHVSGAGHEASAAFAGHLGADDWLHCHYRDKALMIARGLTGEDFFNALLCNDHSVSRGRQMSAHLSKRSLKICSLCGPVGNSALQAAGIAAAIKHQPQRPVVLFSAGDGTTQEGEYLEALCEAAREQLPVIFLVEDNHWAISTPTTGRTFYNQGGQAEAPVEFHGVPILHIDGRYPQACYQRAGEIVDGVRRDRGPVIVVMDVERLANHTNADDQRIYRHSDEIDQAWKQGDPLTNLAVHLQDTAPAQSRAEIAAQLARIRAEVDAELQAAQQRALDAPPPVATHQAKAAVSVDLSHPSHELRGQGDERTVTMKDALRDVLRHHLETNGDVVLLGEDIEDPKGDVFGVTKGLSTRYPGRVRNSPLSESTIVGTSVGQALAGKRPVAFIQFADFLPLAYNQLATELGSMFWRSAGEWSSPVIVMVPCGGYRPGLGPFHSHTLESVITHIPGVDVFMPSTATDAAGLLNAAFRSPRPSVFFYPKSLLNDPASATTPDVQRQLVPIGVARKARVGRDITFVGWGNTVRLCVRAADALEQVGIESEVLDLRSLSPWDEQAVLASAEKTARLVVVHEDNHTCGFGGEVLATVAEKARMPVAMRRVTRSDTFVPCHFPSQLEVLPSFQRVLASAAELLNLDLKWIEKQEEQDGFRYVEAIGSGPSDETVLVSQWLVAAGDTVAEGQPVAALEATKSVFEITSPYPGTVAELLVAEGESIAVGQPLLKIQPTEQAAVPQRRTGAVEDQATPQLTRRKQTTTLEIPRRDHQRRAFDVGLSEVSVVTGSRMVDNDELIGRTDAMTSEDILRRTGIERRCWVGENETAVKLAVQACWEALDRERLIVDDLDLLICSTTSPNSVTPSMACQVLNGMTGGKTDTMMQAYDINAACSGYLYALQAGFDYLQSTPHGRVLVVTAEVLSPLLDPNDFDTAILFGDAVSATVLYGEAHFERARARLFRPELSAKGEDGSSLSVPFPHDGFIQMKGRRVFTEAVRSMVASLNRVCEHQGLTVDQLDMVVPHQANQRIIDAVQNRVDVSVFSNIRYYGNTSSTSIPLCLRDLLPTSRRDQRLGMCAFGGGFTFGAGILQGI